MHINDVYALRDVLAAVQAGMRVDNALVASLHKAAEESIEQFETMLEEMALAEEAAQE